MFEELACGLLFCYFIGWGCIYKVIKVPGDKITWGRSWILQIFFLWKCQGKNLHGDESSGDEISAMKVQSWNVQAKNIQWIDKWAEEVLWKIIFLWIKNTTGYVKITKHDRTESHFHRDLLPNHWQNPTLHIIILFWSTKVCKYISVRISIW